ncbi:thiolase C-terminal domain-containing protein [Haladaptatus sp. ZSTT2]|uniref:thiolase C-terminal domain-containing protein n=1 Tax=Haladaptatus sp. ZSTT2 TaxID=3120515 RepID=UPI00300F1BBF
MPDPCIIGVGTSPIGRTDLTGRDLFAVAMEEAFSGLPDPASFVDAVYAGSQSEMYEHQIMMGTLLAEWAGLRNVPAERVEACAAAGGLALKNAMRDVKTGTHDAVLACGVEKMTAGGTSHSIESLSGAFDRALEQRSGITAPSQYALIAQRYLHESGITEEELAEISVKNHHNASQNPRAHFQKEVDIDDVMESDYIAPPIKLYDCAPVSDGAAAVIVVSEDLASELVSDEEQVKILGSSVTSNNLSVADRNLTSIEGAEVAAERAYDEAGMSAEDMDVAEVHDAFTACEALLAEAAGFAPWGEGIQTVRDPAERSADWTDVHINTSGGLKARGHPTGATGLLQAVEVYEQLTGNATAGRQIENANAGLLINEGGVADACTVAHVLSI